ncbi:MAG: hypothetical protein ACREAC_24450, partial [Blastocatellia bacterium]
MKRPAVFLFLFTSVWLLGNSQAEASTIRVPADYPTIQAAINASADADTILVSKGTYRENIKFAGKNITLQSESGPQDTILDGNSANSVVTLENGEITATIQGFTIQNGSSIYGSGYGGGITLIRSSATIIGNIVQNNQSEYWGGGIAVVSAPACRIANNTISNNKAK